MSLPIVNNWSDWLGSTRILGPDGLPWSEDCGTVTRARRLEQKNLLARGVLNRITENVIGTGIKIRPMTSSEEFNKRIGELWSDWTNSTQCHTRRELSFGGIQRAAFRGMMRDGDCMPVLVDRTDKGFRFPEIDIVGSDRIVQPVTENPDRCVDGLEYGDYNALRAAWVTEADDTERRIPARDLVFLKHHLLSDAGRGVTAFEGSFDVFTQLAGHIESVVVAARIAACQAMIVRRKGGAPKTLGEKQVLDAAGRPWSAKAMAPGMINFVDDGEEVTQFNPQQPHAHFVDFVRTLCRFIGVPFGLTVERVLLDFSKANYTVSRSTSLQEMKAAEPMQEHMAVIFICRIYRWFVSKMVKLGRVGVEAPRDMWLHDWIPNPYRSVEPMKDALGWERMMKLGIETPENVATELGYEWPLLLQSWKKSMGDLTDAGLKVPWFGGSQPTPPDDEQEKKRAA